MGLMLTMVGVGKKVTKMRKHKRRKIHPENSRK
jgi:hypothetical protein